MQKEEELLALLTKKQLKLDKEKKLAEYKLFITSEPKIEKIDYGNLYIEWDVEKNLAEGKKIEDLIDKYAVEFNMGSKKLINKYAEEFNIEIKRGDEKKIADVINKLFATLDLENRIALTTAILKDIVKFEVTEKNKTNIKPQLSGHKQTNNNEFNNQLIFMERLLDHAGIDYNKK